MKDTEKSEKAQSTDSADYTDNRLKQKREKRINGSPRRLRGTEKSKISLQIKQMIVGTEYYSVRFKLSADFADCKGA